MHVENKCPFLTGMLISSRTDSLWALRQLRNRFMPLLWIPSIYIQQEGVIARMMYVDRNAELSQRFMFQTFQVTTSNAVIYYCFCDALSGFFILSSVISSCNNLLETTANVPAELELWAYQLLRWFKTFIRICFLVLLLLLVPYKSSPLILVLLF